MRSEPRASGQVGRRGRGQDLWGEVGSGCRRVMGGRAQWEKQPLALGLRPAPSSGDLGQLGPLFVS